MLHRPAVQVVVQLHGEDGGCPALVLAALIAQPVVEVILQVPIPQLHRLQDDVGIACEEVSVKVGGHGNQVELLHTPDLQARLLPRLEELGVFHHHAARLVGL